MKRKYLNVASLLVISFISSLSFGQSNVRKTATNSEKIIVNKPLVEETSNDIGNQKPESFWVGFTTEFHIYAKDFITLVDGEKVATFGLSSSELSSSQILERLKFNRTVKSIVRNEIKDGHLVVDVIFKKGAFKNSSTRFFNIMNCSVVNFNSKKFTPAQLIDKVNSNAKK